MKDFSLWQATHLAWQQSCRKVSKASAADHPARAASLHNPGKITAGKQDFENGTFCIRWELINVPVKKIFFWMWHQSLWMSPAENLCHSREGHDDNTDTTRGHGARCAARSHPLRGCSSQSSNSPGQARPAVIPSSVEGDRGSGLTGTRDTYLCQDPEERGAWAGGDQKMTEKPRHVLWASGWETHLNDKTSYLFYRDF